MDLNDFNILIYTHTYAHEHTHTHIIYIYIYNIKYNIQYYIKYNIEYNIQTLDILHAMTIIWIICFIFEVLCTYNILWVLWTIAYNCNESNVCIIAQYYYTLNTITYWMNRYNIKVINELLLILNLRLCLYIYLLYVYLHKLYRKRCLSLSINILL